MDRRFLCPACGAKWFARDAAPDPASCGRCSGDLVPFAEPRTDQPVDAERPAR